MENLTFDQPAAGHVTPNSDAPDMLPQSWQSDIETTSVDPIDQFREAMRQNAVPYGGEIIADGKLHRCFVEGDRRGSRNGWYVLHLDGKPAGAFGSMRAGGGTTTWSLKGTKPLTREERGRLKKEMEENRARRAAELAKERADAAAKAVAMWEAAKPVDDHPYLARKQVKSYGLKVGTWVRDYGSDPVTGEVKEHRIAKALMIPLRNAKKQIVSLQAIFPNDENPLKREKDFLIGGEKRGSFFTIGKPTQFEGTDVVVLAEGYATGASIHAATGLAIIVVFDAGNLLPVAKSLRGIRPETTLLFAADNDAWTDKPVKNPGRTRAVEAAEAVKGKVVYPIFADVKTKPTDFNDLAVLEGEEMVRAQILDGLTGPFRGVEPLDGPPDDEPPPYTEIPDGPIPEGLMPERVDRECNESRKFNQVEEETGGPSESTAGFRILGHDKDHIYVFQNEKRMITRRGEASWDKNALLTLADLNWWEMHFAGEKGMNKDMAVNWIIRTANKRGFFDPGRCRGRGAWLDEGRIVYHFGNSLMVDGVHMGLTEIKSHYVYEQGVRLGLPSETALTAEEGKGLYNLATKFRWSRPASAMLLSGWCAIAPVAGALRWRPHIWLTGGAGSGKSTILNEYIHFLMNGMDLFAQGNSTEAGLRQTLGADALPVLFDESEQNNEREQNRVQGILALIRQASTESAAKTLKGTTHGSAMNYHIRSPFCLSSIQVGMKHQADYERFAILALRPKKETEDAAAEWKVLSAAISELHADKTLPARLLRRSLELLPITLINIGVFAAAAASRFGSQREGDQYGALLAGAWSLVSDKEVKSGEAERMIDRYDWADYLENHEIEESTKALGALLGAHIWMPRGERATVCELVSCAVGRDAEDLGFNPKEANRTLRQYGMAVRHGGPDPSDCVLLVAYDWPERAKLLEGTPFVTDLKGQLLRIPGAARFDKTVTLSKIPTRCVAIPMSAVLPDERSMARPRQAGGDDDVPF